MAALHDALGVLFVAAESAGVLLTLPTGAAEQTVSFASGEHPFVQAGDSNYFVFAPGEFWPAT